MLAPSYPRPFQYLREGYLVRQFTEAEDDLMSAMDGEGLSPAAIGRRLGRNPQSIIDRLEALARRDVQTGVFA